MNKIEMISNSNSLAAEAYRHLRSNILFSNYDEELKTIVVTSSQPGEGKSTTSVNLAIAFAQDGKKVLLIDADMRKPTLHQYFRKLERAGLSEALSRQEAIDNCLVVVEEPSLSILFSGTLPPNPAEMLGSRAMEELLTTLKERYDFIIIDSPPVLAVTDAQILIMKTDACLLVTDTKMTKRKQLLEAKRRLDTIQARIIGVVSNRIEEKTDSYYYYN